MLNIAHYLDAAMRRAPDTVAVVHDGVAFSYAHIDGLANRIANGLTRAGLGRGSRIGLCCTNRPEFVASYFGILKIGGCVMSLDFTSTHRDFVKLLEDAQAEALLCVDGLNDNSIAERAVEAAAGIKSCKHVWIIPKDPSGRSPLRGVPSISDLTAGCRSTFVTAAVDPGDVAVVVYTSGTTGRRKGVQITHGNVHSVAMMTLPLADSDLCRRRLAPNNLDCIMAQLYLVILPVLCGHTTILLERSDPEFVWQELVNERATYLLQMPLYYKQLLDHANGVDASQVRKTLRLCATGGTVLPPEWSTAFAERFGPRLLPGYGATEVTAAVSWTCPGDRYKTGAVGRPIPGVMLRIIDENGAGVPPGEKGEVIVRSPGIMKGYLGMNDATAAAVRDGWYHTRDYGALDDDGYLFLYGRADSKIICGHGRVDPTEIELILHEHPAVSLAAVVGVPHPELGQEAKAFVVLEQDQAIGADQLLGWLKCQLPDAKCPRILQLRDSLPLTETGKIAVHLLS